MLVPVLLYGVLGKKYGKRHMLHVSSPREAVRALIANFRTFERDLMEYAPGFHVFRGRENLSEHQLTEPSSTDAIRIVPALAGAKRGGVLQIIAGIVLIIVGAVIQYFSAGSGSSVSALLYKAGALMILGGVVQVLFAPPAPSTNPKEKDPTNQPSYVFNGAVNTLAQGHNVPWGCGRMRTGSATISGGIYVDQIGTNGADSIDTTTPTDPVIDTTTDGGSLGGGVLRVGESISGVTPDPVG